MNHYFIKNVLVDDTFLGKYRATLGYFKSLTHNIIAGNIDEFEGVLQCVVDDLSVKDGIDKGEKMLVTLLNNRQHILIKIANKGTISTIIYQKVPDVFNVKMEREFWNKNKIRII